MEINKIQVQNIKGIAILIIIIHNFVGFLLGTGCNEMEYSEKTNQAFLNSLFTTDAVLNVFSFAGWIGVAVFFFLSGFGLTKKYNNHQSFKPHTYFLRHLIKLWKLLIPIYLIYFCIYTTNLKSAIAQISFTINFFFLVKDGFYLDPVVYWFFGAILQFYILFIILRRLSTRYLWLIFAIFFAFQYFIIYSVDASTLKWMRINFMGWGTSFILGMIASRSQIKWTKGKNIATFFIALTLLCISMIIKWLAPLTEISAIVTFISFSMITTTKLTCFIGKISPSIYALHPLIRQPFYSSFLITFASNYHYISTFSFLIITILLSWAHHKLLIKTN